MLEDPRLNFAISARGHAVGVDHFGIQADSTQELASLEALADDASGGTALRWIRERRHVAMPRAKSTGPSTGRVWRGSTSLPCPMPWRFAMILPPRQSPVVFLFGRRKGLQSRELAASPKKRRQANSSAAGEVLLDFATVW